MLVLRTLVLAALAVGLAGGAGAAPGFRTLGQPDLASIGLASRCADANAQFNFSNAAGFDQHGPSGLAIDPGGRLFVTDFGGNRVLSWPDFAALESCAPADQVIGAGELTGPEAVVIDQRTGNLFVANTLDHTVIGYRFQAGQWTRFVRLGTSGQSGSSFSRFFFPRGLAVDAGGRLLVADDFNNRVLIFAPPFGEGEAAADSLYAGANGGFAHPKGLAMTGNTLFVADYDNGRVLRFTGPFNTPDETYVATGTFSGLINPIDVAVHPEGDLLVTEQGRERVARFTDAVFAPSRASPNSAFAENIGPEPLGVAADRDGRVYVADYRQYRVLIRDESVTVRPVSANASAAARQMLASLRHRPERNGNRVAIGQQLITWKYGRKSDPKAWYGDWLQLKQSGLPLPIVMGGEVSDLMSYPGFSPNQAALDELIRHGQRGNIVTLVWHPHCPLDPCDFSTPISTAALKDMVNGATPTGAAWQVQLDRAAAVLRNFKDAGVPVLFRPLHEQNGTFFWWGHGGQNGAALRARQQAFASMWRDMVRELTVVKGLDNLLFVFGANQVNYSEVAPPLTYYPGGGYADAVSIDIYDEELDLAGSQRGLQHYAALIGTGKPFGLAEFGQSYDEQGTGAGASGWDVRTLARRLADSYPRAAFAIAWYSSVEGDPPIRYVLALPDVSFTAELLAHPLFDTQ